MGTTFCFVHTLLQHSCGFLHSHRAHARQTCQFRQCCWRRCCWALLRACFFCLYHIHTGDLPGWNAAPGSAFGTFARRSLPADPTHPTSCGATAGDNCGGTTTGICRTLSCTHTHTHTHKHTDKKTRILSHTYTHLPIFQAMVACSWPPRPPPQLLQHSQASTSSRAAACGRHQLHQMVSVCACACMR